MHEPYVLSFVNSLEMVGMKFVFSILCLENFQFYVIVGKLDNFDNWEGTRANWSFWYFRSEL